MPFIEKCITLCGQSHNRLGTKCQDSSGYLHEDSYSICVVADGHGSSPHFRSGIGSRMAVQVTISELQSVMNNTKTRKKLENNDENTILTIKQSIQRSWAEAVQKHYAENPLTSKETINADRNDNAIIYYGTTLVAAIISKKFTFGIQIGDGGIAIIDSGYNVLLDMMPDDPLCVDNITTSLCDRNAIKEMRHFLYNGPVLAVSAYTDGLETAVDNSILKTYIAGFSSLMYDDDNWNNVVCEQINSCTKINHRDDTSLSLIFDSDLDYELLYKKTFDETIDIEIKQSSAYPRYKISYDGFVENERIIEWAVWKTEFNHEYDGKINNGCPIKFKDSQTQTEYSGETSQFEKNGKGTEIEPDGVKYIGHFENGLRSGHGTIYRKDDKKIFEGDFKNGLKDGEGTEYHDGKKFFTGCFKKGCRHGCGTIYSYDEGKMPYSGMINSEKETEKESSNNTTIYHDDNGTTYYQNIVKKGHFEGNMFRDETINSTLSIIRQTSSLEEALDIQNIKTKGLCGKELQTYSIIVEEAIKLNLGTLTSAKFKSEINKIKKKTSKIHLENSTAFIYYILKELCKMSGNSICICMMTD